MILLEILCDIWKLFLHTIHTGFQTFRGKIYGNEFTVANIYDKRVFLKTLYEITNLICANVV